MLNFCNINGNMACFQSRIWRGCWNSWIKVWFLLEIIERQWHETQKRKWKKLQERGQKSEGKEVKQIEVKVTLTTLKPIHVKWLVDFYNHMTTREGEQVISSGWCAGGITNAWKIEKLVWNHWTRLLILTH